MRPRKSAWTDEDDERLRTFVAQEISIVRAAAALKRSIARTRARARTIGCPFPTLRLVRRKWADRQDNLWRGG
jgi:hypothetical protein